MLIDIVHGSHRFHYVYDRNSNEKQLDHKVFESEVTIPESCIILLHEKLIHAGSGSMTCGHVPIHSPRFFSYIHHKEKEFAKDFSFRDLKYCDEGCKFCSDTNVNLKLDTIKSSLKFLEHNGIGLASKNKSNDWIAGDFINLGCIIIRSGVVAMNKLEQKLAHEFQTLFLTKNPFKNSPKSS